MDIMTSIPKKNNIEAQHPNIIYILADDMGYGDLSCLNEDSKLLTTNFDLLATEGILFTDAHSSSSVCTPSRYSILTGRYNWRSSLKQSVLFGYSESVIEDDRLTVASLLKQKGYKTACIGKWHLGLNWEWIDKTNEEVDFTKPISKGPVDFGFDYFYGISASLDMPPYVYIENNKATQIPDHITKNDDAKAFWREGPTAPDFKHTEVMPNLTKKVLNTIDTYSDSPFFIYYPLPAPHTPILPTEKFQGISGTNSYGDFVLMCDDVVGQITNKLKEKGIYDNTIIVFTSDNGCSPCADYNELATYGHNPSYIYRGHKADIYEGGHRIPLIVSWPDKIKPNSISDEPVCLVDFMTTVANIVDIKLPDEAGEDSISNLPIWLDKPYEKPLRNAIVHHSIDGCFSIRKDNWKLEMCPGSGGWSYPATSKGQTEGLPPIQLYDLDNDIKETQNVYEKYPEVVNELKNLLTKYIVNGRSTPGSPQNNTGAKHWPQLNWFDL